MNQRIMAVDPGEKRLGIAISDESGTIANPLTVIKHVARLIDAAAIAQLAKEYEAALIVVGQALDSEGYPGPAARRSARLAEALRTQTDLPIKFWDESGSTRSAQTAQVAMGVSRSKRKGHLDDLAATVILQSYLDEN
ncbi:MAG TPA: Holliday junction resolvase RuvX [Anaerolineaceae bacterium]|nr:Holliday junction resolvase RuvX [Anaerolineaceae bacterium]